MTRRDAPRSTLRALGLPRPVAVRTGPRGDRPVAVDGRPVEAVREEWRVEEGWWSERPVRRRYLEVVLEGGRLAVLFEDLLQPGTWFAQRS
jgi:hypothetical protein